jgi:tRNA U34 5-methylaminomethyl-2-thiouridine-forming methyltransferase MnmC
MSHLEIITTSDGSHSLLNKNLNETYHSHHGALQESVHVFINQGLKFLLSKSPASVNIFEVGFGTGLNALLTLQLALRDNISITYTSVEAFPLEKNVWEKLNYATAPEDAAHFQALHEAPWNSQVQINSRFTLMKLLQTLQETTLAPSAYNLIYFDAFAPNKQPEMWELSVLRKIAESMTIGGVFVTYCAKGQLKRDLKTLGLQVETLEGPPGKKEMVRALKI